ncbi:MAG: hypothetical protein K6343_01550, partial [Caldisericaceae bacterium]
VKMEENEPILKLTKEVASNNLWALSMLMLTHLGLLLHIDNSLSTREFGILVGIHFILLTLSFVSIFPILDKKYVYEESVLNSVSRKMLIAFIVCSITVGFSPSIALIASELIGKTFLNTPIVFSYIAIALFLLSIVCQIYYFSKMKITYFFILLLGVFLVEYLILSYYTLWTTKGIMLTFILTTILTITLNIVIYKKA